MRTTISNRKAAVGFASVMLAGSFFFFGGLAQAAGEFDPADCARIVNVDVPFDVDASDTELTFSGTSVIKVSDARIDVDGAIYSDQKWATALHRDLRGFLQSAAEMATISAAFGMDWSMMGDNLSEEDFANENSDEFLTALTNMCQAVLELDESQSAIESSFDAFVAPVKLELSE